MARPEAISVRQSVDTYLSLRSDLAAGSMRQYRLTLDKVVRRLGPDTNLRNITPRHLEEYLITGPVARAKMVGPVTFNKEVALIRTWLKFCSGRGWCPAYLLDAIHRMKEPQTQKLRISPAELQFMLDDQDHPRDRMIVALGLNTALRASEMSALRIKDVDLDGGWLYTTLIKNGKVDVFPINSDFDQELRRWFRWYTEKVGPLHPEYFLIPARTRPPMVQQPNGMVRPSPEPDGMVKPLTPCLTHIRTPIHRSLEKLGYPTTRQGLHTLRRSVARAYYDKLAAEGEEDPLRVTQQLLNHASAQMTERYLGVERERRKRDESLRGKPFLSSLVSGENVVQFGGRKVDGDRNDQGHAV